MININLTPKSIQELNEMLDVLAARGLLAEIKRSKSPVEGKVDENKNYLNNVLMLRRTPVVSPIEYKLRTKFSDVNWTNLEERHLTLLRVGYDISNVYRDKDFTSGEPFSADTSEINLDNIKVKV